MGGGSERDGVFVPSISESGSLTVSSDARGSIGGGDRADGDGVRSERVV